MESSPILIVRLPFEKTEDDVANIFLDMENSPINDEYHIMVLKNYQPGSKEIQFEAVNANHTELQFEQLKNRLLKEMEKAQLSRFKNNL